MAKKKLTFKDFVNSAKNAPNKDKIFAGICFAVAVGLAVWYIAFVLI